MTRITLQDDAMSAVVKMVEGNPGAATVCTGILKQGQHIDPDAMMGGLGTILWMDTLEIYGSKIWMLFKDVCGEDLTKMLGLLRAVQLGLLSKPDLNAAILNCGQGIDVDELLEQVKAHLPNFGN
jgi:hypothetical protein